jgi:hypothetical protein
MRYVSTGHARAPDGITLLIERYCPVSWCIVDRPELWRGTRELDTYVRLPASRRGGICDPSVLFVRTGWAHQSEFLAHLHFCVQHQKCPVRIKRNG